MHLTLQQKESLLEKNNRLLHAMVWRFKARLSGRYNNAQDLYQEAVAAYMAYLNDCQTEQELALFPGMDIIHAMSRYIMGTQPLALTSRTSDFNRHISSLPGTVPLEKVENYCRDVEDGCFFPLYLRDFCGSLNEVDRNVFRLRYRGYRDCRIAQELNISPATVSRAVRRLREKYRQYAA